VSVQASVLTCGCGEEWARGINLRNPQTEYTQRLVAAVPVPDPAEQRRRREASAGLFD
jgi:peptide/nickel transport system ATP-binding protein